MRECFININCSNIETKIRKGETIFLFRQFVGKTSFLKYVIGLSKVYRYFHQTNGPIRATSILHQKNVI